MFRLRLWQPILAGLGFAFDEAYVSVAWLSWVPNLIVAELYIGLRRVPARRVTE